MKTNQILNADNLTVLLSLPDQSIDLVYADPPFNTGRDFSADKGGYTDTPTEARELPQEFAWLHPITSPKTATYFATLIPRLQQIKRILKTTGALYWHCDHRTNAPARLVLNQIFGKKAFRNEIAWIYQAAQMFDTIKHMWNNNYDNILFYALQNHTFQHQYHPRSLKEIRDAYPHTDSHGQKFKWNRFGKLEKKYAHEDPGKRIPSAWTDIPIAPELERTGYPTQKPLALLRRIIKASSNEGDIILDPYCGSGTTLLAANQLKRKWLGIDQNPEAVAIARKRIKNRP